MIARTKTTEYVRKKGILQKKRGGYRKEGSEEKAGGVKNDDP